MLRRFDLFPLRRKIRKQLNGLFVAHVNNVPRLSPNQRPVRRSAMISRPDMLYFLHVLHLIRPARGGVGRPTPPPLAVLLSDVVTHADGLVAGRRVDVFERHTLFRNQSNLVAFRVKFIKDFHGICRASFADDPTRTVNHV